MKKVLLAVCLSMALVMMVAPAYSMELWEPVLPGNNEGLAAGALPPAGFYFVNLGYYTPSYKVYGSGFTSPVTDQSQANSQIKITGYVDVPVLLWSTGCKFLGADFGMALVQPFDATSLRIGTSSFSDSTGPGVTGDQVGTFNTVLVPFILSWKIPCDIRVKAALAIGVDDAWSSIGSSAAATTGIGSFKLFDKNFINAYAWSGLDEWFFTPNIGLSWLYHGWNISADLFYTWSLKADNVPYQSGDMFQADYTVSYTCGKWTFGVGATQNIQVNSDKFNAGDGTGYHSQPFTKETKYMGGPLIGYNFGPCSLMLIYNFNMYAENAPAGDTIMARFVVPLGNPYPLGGK